MTAEWPTLKPFDRNRLRARLLDGAWLEACRVAVENTSLLEIDRWLNGEGSRTGIFRSVSEIGRDPAIGRFFVRQMRAYLHCAKSAVVSEQSVAAEFLIAAHEETSLPIEFYRDLAAILKGGFLLAGEGKSQRLTVLLIDNAYKGVAAHLVLERIRGASCTLYPSPYQGFIYRDDKFLEAEQTALRYAWRARGQKYESNVRWSLEGVAVGGLRLTGSSMGGALAVALRLLQISPGDQTDFAVTATVESTGTLGPVEQLGNKVVGGQFAQSRLKAVITAASGDPCPISADSQLLIRKSETVEEAVRIIRTLSMRPEARRFRFVISQFIVLVVIALCVFILPRQLAHSYSVRGGGRIIVTEGIMEPFAPHADIDTGLLQNGLDADSFADLREEPYIWSLNPEDKATDELINALPATTRKAILLERLGLRPQAETVLLSLLQSEQSTEQATAATMLVELSQGYRPAAIAVTEARFDKCRVMRSGGAVETGDALLTLEPDCAMRIARTMKWLADPRGNNFVNIPALHVMVRADPGTRPYAIQYMKRLLKDPNVEIEARAASFLYDLEPDQRSKVLSILVPLLVNHGDGTTRAALAGLTDIGRLYPHEVSVSIQNAYQMQMKGSGQEGNQVREIPVVDRSAEAIMVGLASANNIDFRDAVAETDGLEIADDANSEALTRFLGMRIAEQARLDYSRSTPMNYLLNEMNSPLADQYATYRNGCGYAIAFVTPVGQRQSVYERIYRLWSGETRPHIKIALCIAREQLSERSNNDTSQ